MALNTKVDLPDQLTSENVEFARVSSKFPKETYPTTQTFTSASSGASYTYNSDQELLNKLQASALINSMILAQDWNGLQTFVQDQISIQNLEINQIKIILEANDLYDFANQTGSGFLTGFGDIEGIDTTNTTATINTSAGLVTFDGSGNQVLQLNSQQYSSNFNNISLRIMTPETFQVESDGAFTSVDTIDVYTPYELTTNDTILSNNVVLDVIAVTNLT